MSRFFALALNLSGEPKSPKMSKALPRFRTDKSAAIIVIFLILVGISYLVLVNDVSTKGYEIKRLEKQLLEVKETNKRLEIEAASMKTMEAIQAEANILNLVPSTGVNYPKETSFSLKQ